MHRQVILSKSPNIVVRQNVIPTLKRAIFKCTIFVGYGGVIFFTGVAPSATEKSHPFSHTSGSNQVNVFVNKTKHTE